MKKRNPFPKLFPWLAGLCLVLLSCRSQNESPIRFTSDPDGMLVIEGRRTFIIGSYYLYEGDRPFAEMAGDGYNYVRLGRDPEQLDRALEQGLYAWVNIGSIDPGNRQESEQGMRDHLRALKGHPALLCWETQDEPAFTWNSAEIRVPAARLIDTYGLIKKEDPVHLVYMNHAPVNLVSTLQMYNPAADVIACDIYPVIPPGIRISYALFPDGIQGDLLNTYLSQVGEYTDKMRQVGGASKPLFMVLQGFSWEMLREAGDRDTAMILYPDYHQTRFMAYNAIIHGANGIIYWGTRYTPPDAPFWRDLKSVTRELGDMQEVLASPSVDLDITRRYHELGHSVDAGVEILVKAVDGELYLITANADRYPAKVSLGGLDGYRQARVLAGNRILDIRSGELMDDYEAFDVHIFHLIK